MLTFIGGCYRFRDDIGHVPVAEAASSVPVDTAAKTKAEPNAVSRITSAAVAGYNFSIRNLYLITFVAIYLSALERVSLINSIYLLFLTVSACV